jgi:hypothetical protein
MAKKSSFFLAVLLIANPFMLLFFQNCATLPQASKFHDQEIQKEREPAAQDATKEVVFFHYK